MQSSRKWDTDAVWIPEVDTDLDAETAQLRKHIDFKRLRARFARGNRQRVKSLVTWGNSTFTSRTHPLELEVCESHVLGAASPVSPVFSFS